MIWILLLASILISVYGASTLAAAGEVLIEKRGPRDVSGVVLVWAGKIVFGIGAAGIAVFGITAIFKVIGYMAAR